MKRSLSRGRGLGEGIRIGRLPLRALAILLVFVSAGSATQTPDVEIVTRPDVLVVEMIAGNLTPVERLFFHIVARNTTTHPIEIQWVRFDVVNPSGALLSGQYSGEALTALFDSAIDRGRIEPTAKQSLMLEPDERKAISDIFFDCPRGFIGESLSVEVAYKSGDTKSFSRASTPLRRNQGFAGRLPFDGTWYVASEHGFLDAHKRLLTEAFAYDFLQIGANSKSYQGAGTQNTDFFAYGKKVLAAKDGAVIAVRTDIAENTPGIPSYVTPGGNVVVIDHGDGQYGYYAHLKPFTITVKVGARVRAGDPIGEVGNSGDSLEPHLHFHVMDDPDLAHANGIQAVFSKWKSQAYGSRPVERELGILPRGEFVAP